MTLRVFCASRRRNANGGANAIFKLTFQLDHSVGAGQFSKLTQLEDCGGRIVAEVTLSKCPKLRQPRVMSVQKAEIRYELHLAPQDWVKIAQCRYACEC